MPAQLSKNWFQSLRDMFIGQPPANPLMPLQAHTPLSQSDMFYASERLLNAYKKDQGTVMDTNNDVAQNESGLLPLLYQALSSQTGGARTVARSNGFNSQFASLLDQTTVPQSAINNTRFLLGTNRPIMNTAVAQFFHDRGTGEDTVAVRDAKNMTPSTLAHEMQHKFNRYNLGLFPAPSMRAKLAGQDTAMNEFLATLAESKSAAYWKQWQQNP